MDEIALSAPPAATARPEHKSAPVPAETNKNTPQRGKRYSVSPVAVPWRNARGAQIAARSSGGFTISPDPARGLSRDAPGDASIAAMWMH